GRNRPGGATWAGTKVPRARCRPDHWTEHENGTLSVVVASRRADPDSAVDLGVRRASFSGGGGPLGGPRGLGFWATRAGNQAAAGLRPLHYLPAPMDLEDLIRISVFALVFAAMASWEIVAPRRALAVGRRPRWASNLGILAVDVLAVRILIPTAAVGAALFAAGRGWGLLQLAGLRLSLAAL